MAITKATIKSFIKKNKSKLFVSFNGNVVPAIICETDEDNNFGVAGVWLDKRNSYRKVDNTEYVGYHINNYTRNSSVLIKK